MLKFKYAEQRAEALANLIWEGIQVFRKYPDRIDNLVDYGDDWWY